MHRLDPRTKLSVFLFITAVVTFSLSYTANLILLAVTLCLVLLARLSLGYIFSGLRPALPLIVILAILQLLFYGGAYTPYGMETRTLFQWGWIHITNASVQLVVVSMLRFVELLFLTSLLTNTTTLADLTMAWRRCCGLLPAWACRPTNSRWWPPLPCGSFHCWPSNWRLS